MDEIIAATEFGPGHAWIIFLEPVQEDATLSLQRDSETTSNLGVNGWQAQPYTITPLKIEKRGTGSKILIGPKFVDNILDGEYITVKAGSQVFSEFWPSIMPAAKKHGTSIVDKFAKKDTPTPQEPEPKPEIIPELKIEPELVPEIVIKEPKPVEFPKEEVTFNAEHDDVKNIVNAALDGHSANQYDLLLLQPKKNKMSTVNKVSTILFFIFIIFIGLFLFTKYYVLNETQQPEVAQTTTPPETPHEPAAEQSQTDKDFALGRDGWNQLIQAPDTDPQRLYDLGKALRERDGGDADVGFGAIYKAGQKNNKAALEWYARANDPTSDAQGNDRITPPNIRRALETWTTLSKQDPAVRENIKKLCDYLRDRRYSGTTEERTTFQDYCL